MVDILMIKIFLKHHIYEFCLDVLFERINNNFITDSYRELLIKEFYKQERYVMGSVITDASYLSNGELISEITDLKNYIQLNENSKEMFEGMVKVMEEMTS